MKKDYNDLIEKFYQDNHQDKELIKILQHNFIDEHLHTEWFRTKIIAMKQYEFTVKHFSAAAQAHRKHLDVEDIMEDNFERNLKPTEEFK